MDGLFDDWVGAASFSDSPEVTTGINLVSFQVTNDADFLYVKFTTDTELDLTDNIVPQDIMLYIDTDNDAATGFGVQAGVGSEVGINFKDHSVYYDVVPSSTQGFLDIGCHPAPTVSDYTFEIAIRRDAVPDGVNPLFPSATIKLMFKEWNDLDVMPNAGQTFSYTFDETPVAEPAAIDMARSGSNHVRVVAYNTLGNGLINGGRQAYFSRIVPALDADIYAFSECGSTSTTQVKSLMDTWMPLGTVDGWYVEMDEDLITASKWPFLATWTGETRQFPTLIDVDPALGGPMVVINSHLSCCASDAARQNQVDGIMNWMEDAKNPGGSVDLDEGTPIVYCGDLNLVGYSQQLTTLLTGDIQNTATYGTALPPDWDDTNWTDLTPSHPQNRVTYTWGEESDNYPPGRLDFMIISDAVLEAEKAFVLSTSNIDAGTLTAMGLFSGDTNGASDHLPVIADLLVTGLADVDEDGIPDTADNCPNVENPDQLDWNANGIGDACEDSDGDGLSDEEELLVYGTDPDLQDTDDDGLTDGLEVTVGTTDPLDPDSNDNDCEDGLEAMGVCGISCPEDVDGDGYIGVADLLELLGAFGTFCGEL